MKDVIIGVVRGLVEPFLSNKIRNGKQVPNNGQISTQVGSVGLAGVGAVAVAGQITTLQDAIIAAIVAIVNLYFIYKKPKESDVKK